MDHRPARLKRRQRPGEKREIQKSQIISQEPAGCSKRLSSKAAANEEARRTLRYVESLSDARTPLADFFNSLLERLVRPVAVWWRLCVLALTQCHFFLFVHGKLNRLEPSSLV